VNESATATWDLNGGLAGSGGVIGTGAFTVNRPDADTLVVTGTGGLENGDCTFDITGFSLSIDLAAEGGPAGTIDFDATVDGETLDGTMSFDGSDIANVAGNYKGALVNFLLDLNTFLPF